SGVVSQQALDRAGETHCTDDTGGVTQKQLQQLLRIASESAEKAHIFFDWVFSRLNFDSAKQLNSSQYKEIMLDFAFADG
ncbi:MAG: hypothetical protein F6J86_45970, partial [Symploca sp. SIO1B1]|nr:hypothetical protein [Symploca sp. SIO1B1]